MPAQTTPTQELTISEKMKIVQYLAIFPAITIMVFMRRKIGFRLLKPSWLIGMAWFLMFIDGLCNINMLIFSPAGAVFEYFPLLMLAFGFLQRYRRWKGLCRGERWHTYSPGISYFELLPLPAFLRAQRRVYRFLDPLACLISSILIGMFLSQALGRWVFISSFALFIYEQSLFEKQLDRDLDILDGLVASEVQTETVEHFTGEQPSDKERSLQETAGIPTGVAYDIHRQIEIRRARQAAADEKSKAEAVIRQVFDAKIAAGVRPKNITPTIAELSPPLPTAKPMPPDNLAPEMPPTGPGAIS